MFYGYVKLFFRLPTRIYLGLKAEGCERVPRHGPALIAANHASFLDPIVLGSACPRKIHFVVLQSMYEWKRLRWFYWGMQTIPVRAEESDPRAVKQALTRLRRGDLVGIFPEGGRSADGFLQPAKPGAALLAAISGAPVIPAHIAGAWSAWKPNTLFPVPGRVRVRFGEPIRIGAPGAKPRGREEVDAFSRRIMQAIAALASEGSRESDDPGGGNRAAATRSAGNP
ncbi:MAG TPA: lysophospholipid acyltransferase family protein [Candidatus Polarisedimenticolia bacterium]|jgi:1-acyl-sn-glycerol-3-phosphate acyltransferase|nr:lysophospholipid acyltransferase family protein [Candidatus Polarisedimenticolia bacterium]